MTVDSGRLSARISLSAVGEGPDPFHENNRRCSKPPVISETFCLPSRDQTCQRKQSQRYGRDISPGFSPRVGPSHRLTVHSKSRIRRPSEPSRKNNSLFIQPSAKRDTDVHYKQPKQRFRNVFCHLYPLRCQSLQSRVSNGLCPTLLFHEGLGTFRHLIGWHVLHMRREMPLMSERVF